ncbi:MAG: hypothetical protein IJR66_02155 [Clostridia bacterium]|nr:hypothetical protein [Clostridia bacterium]
MKKKGALTLLSIISVILCFLLIMSFVRFPIGLYDYNSLVGAIDTDYDMAGGASYTLTLAKDNDNEVEDINEVVKTISKRLDELGVSVYSVTPKKEIVKDVDSSKTDYQIRIDVKDTDDATSNVTAATAYGTLKMFGGESANPTEEIFADKNPIKDSKYVGKTTATDGSIIYQVSIVFDDECYKELIKLINDASSYYISITMGDNTLLSGSSAISADYFQKKTLYLQSTTETGAKQLAMQIRTGGLAYKYELSEKSTISSPYGENNQTIAVIVLSVFIVAIVVALFVMFKGFGLTALYSIVSYILIHVGLIIAVPNVIFSASGLIALTLSLIVTADGLYIIFKRINEESNLGKTLKASVKTGYKRSLFPILNTDIMLFVVAILSLIVPYAPIKSFAAVLAIGSIASLVSTLLLSRLFTTLITLSVKQPEKFFNIKNNREATL